MKELNIVVLSVDDWEALYVNGEVFHQNHQVNWEKFAGFLVGQDVRVVSFESKYLDLPEDKYDGSLPFLLSDVEEYTPSTLNSLLNHD